MARDALKAHSGPGLSAHVQRNVTGHENLSTLVPRQPEPNIVEIVQWCGSVDATGLSVDAVPGASDEELRRLGALGGVARAIAKHENIDTSQLPTEVQAWLRNGPEPPSELVERLTHDRDDQVDPLALLYEQLVSARSRRDLGTFFTPHLMINYMTDVLAGNHEFPSNVVDPGAGVGAFTAASLRLWPSAQVHAIDINLVTLGLMAVRQHLFMPSPGGKPVSDSLKLWRTDYLEWLADEWAYLEGPRLIFGNPPYTRHQRMSSALKSKIRRACGLLLPGTRAGLSTYFLAASLSALKDDDSLCMLLPANWVEADYARAIRVHLWHERDRGVQLYLLDNNLRLFPGTQVSAMVIYVGKRSSSKQDLLVAEILMQNGVLRAGKRQLTDRQGNTPTALSPNGISRPRSWSVRKHWRPLNELVFVRRGVATGANSFFLRSKEEIEGLPKSSVVRAIGRLRDVPEDTLTRRHHDLLSKNGVRCWLVALGTEHAYVPEILSLIRAGEGLELHMRYLCKMRHPWYAVERIPPPDLLLGPMGKSFDRRTFRVVSNEAKAIPTNALYGLRMRRSNAEAALRLADWLNSDEGQQSLRTIARRHGDGLIKLEPGALNNLMVPGEVTLPQTTEAD